MLTHPRPGAASFDAPEHPDITITRHPPVPPRARGTRGRWRWRARGSPSRRRIDRVTERRIEQRRLDVAADPMFQLTRFR